MSDEFPPEELVEKYSGGACMWLAVAAARKFGWEIAVQVETAAGEEVIAHAHAVLPDGREFDVMGIADMADRFSNDVRPASETEVFRLTGLEPGAPEAEREIAEATEVIDRLYPDLSDSSIPKP